MKNVLEFMEKSAEKYPDKTVFSDANNSVTYRDFLHFTEAVGTRVSHIERHNAPVAVFLERGVNCLIAMFGIVYSGNFYTVIDAHMPIERIISIFDTLSPVAVLTDEEHSTILPDSISCKRIMLTDAMKEEPDEALLMRIRSEMIDTDPLYALFTSGSTGVPKGAVLCHKNVIAYSEWYNNTFGIDANTVFGSQTPFYFSMSVSDVFGTIRAGASLHILERSLFAFPMKLIERLNEQHINTIYWVPSALSIVANWKALDYASLTDIDKVLFAGEVMPMRQLNYWRRHLPNAMYANLFGPTETTDICTYYIVNRDFEDGDVLPIGKPCDNCGVSVITEDGNAAAYGEAGELVVRGSFIAMGYYNNPDKTAAAFTQNPLNSAYPELVYRTGDIVKYNELGDLIYLSRKDFQVKHMGYRIELGEIEAAASAVDVINSSAAIYDAASDRIILVWEGKKSDDASLLTELRRRLPDYMLPQVFVRTRSMPHNANGKIDRAWLQAEWQTLH